MTFTQGKLVAVASFIAVAGALALPASGQAATPISGVWGGDVEDTSTPEPYETNIAVNNKLKKGKKGGESFEEVLFGKKYHSVSVTKDGEPLALVEGTRLRAKFIRGKTDSVSWHAGCNYYGAHIAIAEDVIDVKRRTMISTDMGCIGDHYRRQDDLFARFFGHDPVWSASGRDLTLSTERVTVELRRRAK